MTTYTWPSTVTPNDMNVEFISNTATFQSPFTGVTKAIGRDAQLIRVTMTFRNLQSASVLSTTSELNNRSFLMAFLAKLNGPEHRVTLPMFAAENLGSWAGSPLVAGASQTGSSLNIDEAGAGTYIPYAVRGDWFSVNDELKIVTADADMTSGAATLAFWPPLRSAPPDNDPITSDSPTGIFMLEQDPVWSNVPGPGGKPLGSCTVTMIEDPTA